MRVAWNFLNENSSKHKTTNDLVEWTVNLFLHDANKTNKPMMKLNK